MKARAKFPSAKLSTALTQRGSVQGRGAESEWLFACGDFDDGSHHLGAGPGKVRNSVFTPHIVSNHTFGLL